MAVEAGTVARPDSVAEAAELFRDTRGTLLFRGGGTKMAWAGRPDQPALLVETGGLHQLLEHNPADMTAVVEAGLPLSTLQEVLGESGQWLALDPPTQADGATIGGLLATGDSGPRRLRYGALRDLVIGVTLVLADGTVAHAGGRVIKNVAGYDLTKLMYGSLGTLALIAEVVLRVHPRAEDSATLVASASVAAAADATRRLMASPLEPAAVDWVGDPREPVGQLAIRFEGSRAGVDAQTAAARELLDVGPIEQLNGPIEVSWWEDLAAAHRTPAGQTTVRAGTRPNQLIDAVDALVAAAGDADIRLVSHLALGLHTAHIAGPPSAQVRTFDQWRGALVALGSTVMLRDRPGEIDAAVDVLGPPPSAVRLMRAVKSRLDPAGRCAPGRLGWLMKERW
jgi:glycolate dehydrogenase FAD-binding subunit